MHPEQIRTLEQFAPLADETRRRVYATVASRYPEAVDRDAVAEALGIRRGLAAFHLDRLAAAGLLEVSFARRSARSGPGAGRPAKFYRRPPAAIRISLPRRRFDLAMRVLARTVVGESAWPRLADEATNEGRRIAAAHCTAGRSPDLASVLDDEGFEPQREGSRIRLRNCPFDAVADSNAGPTPVVCAMNAALIQGIVDGIGVDAQVRARPHADVCCVAIDVSDDA